VRMSLTFCVPVSLALLLVCSGNVPLLQGQDRDAAKKKQEQETAAANAKKSETGSKDSNAGGANAGDSATNSQAPSGYRVGVDDELAISVWHEPEFSQAAIVRPDGMITLPLLNDIKVVGLTTEEIQTLLIEKMKNVVNDPQVTVSVKTIKSRKVYLVGNVVKQGMYPLSGRTTVLELLAEAGGLGPFAKSRSIYVLRKVDGKETRFPFNYKKALSGKGDNPELMSGDMIVVP
jgi:polysaccharide export outer membrane protein